MGMLPTTEPTAYPTSEPTLILAESYESTFLEFAIDNLHWIVLTVVTVAVGSMACFVVYLLYQRRKRSQISNQPAKSENEDASTPLSINSYINSIIFPEPGHLSVVTTANSTLD